MDQQPPRVYVFAHPRSTSHLFYQLLSTHPAFKVTRPLTCLPTYRFGVDSQSHLKSSKAVLNALGLDDEIIATASWQNFVDNLQREAEDAELKGKRFLTMDHPYQLMSSALINSLINVPGRRTWPTPSVVDSKFDIPTNNNASILEVEVAEDRELDPKFYSNPTLIPDRFLFSFVPIFTIRHPAHATPSAYRAWQKMGGDLSHPDFPVTKSYKWGRLFFDTFKFHVKAEMEKCRGLGTASPGTTPIVVDGEQLVKDPQGQMKRVCDILGLDAGGITYNWDKPELWKGTKLGDAFFSTINESNGVVPDPPVDIETEAKKWAQEWDEDTASVLREMVQEDMEDYQYLLQYGL
ncbi:hypothetical protein PM082_021331 [Marasmius tenuissimus]|nr:hypothetical protein PM082_021331 [Marasmius tenuissimus]